jgi:hypothetical protein
MNYKIETYDNYIKVINEKCDRIKVAFINVATTYGIYVNTNLKMGHFALIENTSIEHIKIFIDCDNKENYIYDFYNSTKSLIKVEKNNNFNFNNPITLITGHRGGGTSVVVKMLKYFNNYELHFGDDSGSMDIRKNHESASLLNWVHSFNNNNTIHIEKEKLLNVINSYNYKLNKINIFKVPNIASNSLKLANIFPNIKFISVVRIPNNIYQSKEGKGFNTNPEYYKQQFFKVEGQPLFHLDFIKFFTDYKYFNKVVEFLGCSKRIDQTEFEKIKKDIKFEEKAIK